MASTTVLTRFCWLISLANVVCMSRMSGGVADVTSRGKGQRRVQRSPESMDYGYYGCRDKRQIDRYLVHCHYMHMICIAYISVFS